VISLERSGKQGSYAMRSFRAPLAALLLISMLGCTTDGPARTKGWFSSLPAFRGPTGSDVVQLEWALIERPVGDRYLNEDLWALVNEQVIPLERKDLLENNGLRIAQIGGLLPAEFQELLHSERSNPAPRRRALRAGNLTRLAVGAPVAKCSVLAPNAPRNFVSAPDEAADYDFENVQFNLVASSALVSDGKVRISMTPEIQHGQSKVTIRPSENNNGWVCKQQPNTRTYGELSWDVTLAPDDYLLVGCWFKSKQTYGKECFVRIDEPRPVQRLLVIRAVRQLSEAAGTEVAEENVPPRTVASVAQTALAAPR
jgi:hypothetical protein